MDASQIEASSLKTLTGMTVEQVKAKMDEELPPDAYSQVPGGANLTDIDPGWMRKVLTEVFGLCGIGWGYSYRPEDFILTHLDAKASVDLKHLVFWYILVDRTGQNRRFEIFSSGGSDNRSMAYAMKGAITNAIGHAVSNLGFQESVYLGKRTHVTVRSKSTTGTRSGSRTGASTEPVKVSSPTASSPSSEQAGAELKTAGSTGTGTRRTEEEILKELGFSDPGQQDKPVTEYLISGGAPKHNGLKLAQLSEAALLYYANLDGKGPFRPVDAAGKLLQAKAREYLAEQQKAV